MRSNEQVSDDTTTAETLAEMREGDITRLRRRLSGDLDTIMLMALRKEPERRYASVDQLATDIRSHLKGRPVIARSDTFLYRTGKFVRRNRLMDREIRFRLQL